MKNKVFNPYLPLDEYIPDGEPYVFGDRLYVYGSHDKQNGEAFCLLDYVCYSAPINDLSDWRYEGVIYKKDQDPENQDGTLQLYAPDVCKGPDGNYYLYYCLNTVNLISVAMCSEPAGKYEFLGYVKKKDGSYLTENLPFDPAVLNDKGSVHLYYGFSPTNIDIPGMPENDKILGCSYAELEADMITAKCEPKIVIPSETYSKGSGFEGHEHFEAPSIRKIGDLFYLIYSSVLSHELCYCTSKYPDREFNYGGTIVSNGDIGLNGKLNKDKVAIACNNHGGIVEVNGQWYIFYHRHTHGHQFSRQGCAEPIEILEDGSIPQVEITTSGLYGAPLPAEGLYPAAICSMLTNDKMPDLLRDPVDYKYPFIYSNESDVFISNITDGNLIGFKYFNINKNTNFSVKYRGECLGRLLIGFSENEAEDLIINISPSVNWTNSEPITLPEHTKTPLFLKYEGDSVLEILSIDFN